MVIIMMIMVMNFIEKNIMSMHMMNMKINIIHMI